MTDQPQAERLARALLATRVTVHQCNIDAMEGVEA